MKRAIWLIRFDDGEIHSIYGQMEDAVEYAQAKAGGRKFVII